MHGIAIYMHIASECSNEELVLVMLLKTRSALRMELVEDLDKIFQDQLGHCNKTSVALLITNGL